MWTEKCCCHDVFCNRKHSLFSLLFCSYVLAFVCLTECISMPAALIIFKVWKAIVEDRGLNFMYFTTLFYHVILQKRASSKNVKYLTSPFFRLQCCHGEPCFSVKWLSVIASLFEAAKPPTGTKWSPFSLRWFLSRLRRGCCEKVTTRSWWKKWQVSDRCLEKQEVGAVGEDGSVLASEE